MSNQFGGIWTHIKLDVLDQYLNSYSHVFKKQYWCHLLYIDAFAGTGKCDTRDGLIDGSAKIALNIPRFNEFIFIELDKEKIKHLENLKESYPDKKITIIHGDCNNEVLKIINKYNWKTTRALSFLDPYQMELSFSTLQAISSTQSVDVWYLFPINQATRAMRNDGSILESDRIKLNNLFGDSTWEDVLYYEDPQINLFNDSCVVRKDQKSICCYFKEKMETLFASVSCPVCLRNSNNAPLFLLYFAVSNDRAKTIANRIAGHIIFKEQTFVCKHPKKLI